VNYKTAIILSSTLFFAASGFAQFQVEQSSTGSYYQENYLRYSNFSYRPNIKTVMLHPKGWPLAAPILYLGENEVLELHFDVLDTSLGNYMYSILHCDHDWKKSELDLQEYLDGPPEDYLNNYAYSRNTYQRYINYSLEIPNFNVRLTKSGNYLIRVYEEGNPENLILTRRFCVAERKVNLNIRVHQATLVKERYSHQEVDFSIFTNGYQVTNPYTDLHVVILQNHTWETALTGLEPRFVKDSEFDYNYDGKNTFPGLNEYRLFDIKNTRFTGQGVSRMTFANSENHAYLDIEKSRSAITYLQRMDINGWYFIKNDRISSESNVDADYVTTHFSLSQNPALTDGDVYVFGALTDWQIKPEAKMTYSQSDLQYQVNLYLKQGLYNYTFVFVKDGEIIPDMARFEGSHFETENEYTILVYHRPLGLDYEKLIGIEEFKYSNN
jgi:hypothetical protein